MNNNDILRRLRFAFKLSNKQACELFNTDPASSVKLSQADFLARIAKEPDLIVCSDVELAAFLDGLIVHKRGLRESVPAKTNDVRLSKNDILKKLRIALGYREQDMLAILKAGGSDLSKNELSALFRAPSHKNYRPCGNQVLRNFIKGLTESLAKTNSPNF